ncbi:MAG TPA: flagellar basal body protein [Ilumatobacteraceae bacterium]|nr:flagellar basal body protein [Ilumatobacteraceae bacterium]
MPTLSTSSLLVASRTALLAKMLGVDMVSQNLANVNTYGYRGQRMNFQELLNDRTNINGVQPVATQILLAPGRLETTGRSLDLAVDGDRKRDAILGDERGERVGRHHIVVLENAVQTEHLHLIAPEAALHALGGGDAVADAAGAQHLEDLDQHDLAA